MTLALVTLALMTLAFLPAVPLAAVVGLTVAALVLALRRLAVRRAIRTRLGGGSRVVAPVRRRDRHADQLLDVAQIGPLLAVAERDRHALRAGARSAADAVHVALRNVRKVVVDDMADAIDIDAARRDVGRHQRAHLAGAERRQHALALALRLVAVDGLGGEAGLFERTNHLVGAVLGAGEDECAIDRLLPQDLDEQRRLAGAVDVDDALIDLLGGRGFRRDGDPNRVAQHALGQLRDLVRHGGREEQGLPAVRQLADDRADVVDESHVEHAVGFVEHEDFDLIEPHGAHLHQVAQPAGRCDEHIDAAHEIADLTIDRHAADGERDARVDVAAIRLEALDDLGGEFARRAQHQHAAGALFKPLLGLREVIEDRQREGGGLAGSGLRDADDVACGQYLRDGLGLDRRGVGVLFLNESAGDGLGQAELEKGGQ